MILTSIWGVGFMGVFGYNLDPLMLVVPFLISARAMSHGIQKLERYFLELSRTGEKIPAARNTFNALFRPGALAIVADASALYLIGLGSVPINDKMAIYASFWAVCMVVTVLIVIPMLLAELPRPKNVARQAYPGAGRVSQAGPGRRHQGAFKNGADQLPDHCRVRHVFQFLGADRRTGTRLAAALPRPRFQCFIHRHQRPLSGRRGTVHHRPRR